MRKIAISKEIPGGRRGGGAEKEPPQALIQRSSLVMRRPLTRGRKDLKVSTKRSREKSLKTYIAGAREPNNKKEPRTIREKWKNKTGTKR